MKKKYAVFRFYYRIIKVKCYKKMINVLKELAFAKPNKLLLFIKRYIYQSSSLFSHLILFSINNQL